MTLRAFGLADAVNQSAPLAMLTADNGEGRPEQWAIDMGGPRRLTQQDWVPTVLTPGMKVKAIIPLGRLRMVGSRWR
jgi:hypothetical protein